MPTNESIHTKDAQLSQFQRALEQLVAKLSRDGELSASEKESVDQEVVTTVQMMTAKLISRVLASFSDSFPLQRQLWNMIYAPVILQYRVKIERAKEAGVTEESFKPVYRRLSKILKVASQTYKALVKRILEVEGTTEEVSRLLPVLNLGLETPPEIAAEAIYMRVNESAVDVLCRLGDISRYKTTLNLLKPEENHRHARIYYAAAASIVPAEGTPANQLGNLSNTINDCFDTFFWFLKSQSAEVPFSFDNMKRIAHKLARMSRHSLSTSRLMAIESLGESDRVAIRPVVLSLLWLFANNYHVQVNKDEPKPLDHAVVDSIMAQYRQILENPAIPAHLLIQLALIGPMCTYVAEKNRKTLIHGDMRTFGVFNLTVEMFKAALEVSIRSLNEPEEIPELIKKLLPMLRIFFDWITKYLEECRDWEVLKLQYAPLLYDVYRLAETLRMRCGLEFDPLTAGKIMSGRDTKLNALEEEKQCLGLAPFNGALNDTPSGLAKMDQVRTQCQGLLFSAVELSRLGFTSLQFDSNRFVYVDLDAPTVEQSTFESAVNQTTFDSTVNESSTETIAGEDESAIGMSTLLTEPPTEVEEDSDGDEVVFKPRRR
ncbi:hypothetical protein TRVA0_001S06128 [Trichomonascus vanleenenianus]|uniref:uncharacterized protein n=1 Tax=Trichomonascus vanleenenianus TaxID=2268995 RepID=UPI003ECB24E4